MYKIMYIPRVEGGTYQTEQKQRSRATKEGKLAKARIYKNLWKLAEI